MTDDKPVKSNIIQFNVPTECFCKTYPVTMRDRAGKHHHSLCSRYKIDKYPYLFAWHEEEESWVLVPTDFLQFICDGLENDQAQTIKFARADMTDEELFNECGL